MITTGSKFAYALAALLLASAVVYGYSTGGGEVGPLSAGYKGAVGDHLGYTVLLFGAAVASFIGFSLTAFRDADPDATASLLGGSEAAPTPVAQSSYWPAVGAFAAGLTLVGLVLNNVFFVAGLIGLGVVAIEWTVQAWSERATGDPAVNREIRNRVMLPFEAPLAGALGIAIIIGGFSRVFLTASRSGAVWVALAAAAVIFVVGTLLSTRDQLRTDLVAGLLALAAVVSIGLGIFGAVRGEREFEHHGETTDHSDSSTDQGPAGSQVVEEMNH